MELKTRLDEIRKAEPKSADWSSALKSAADEPGVSTRMIAIPVEFTYVNQ